MSTLQDLAAWLLLAFLALSAAFTVAAGHLEI